MKIDGIERRTVWFENGELCLIDQPKLPHRFEIFRTRDYRVAAKAISTMIVRGAPAIGATGAYAMALAAIEGVNPEIAAREIQATRPTARDLFYGVERTLKCWKAGNDVLDEAENCAQEYIAASKKIGELGAALIKDGDKISTHCNAGWLATVDWGTAMAPVFMANRQGKKNFVFVDETRPRCQGSRLTAYELLNENIDHAVICDNSSGYYMKNGDIDLVIVGSDRIALNGDIANKIGTYSSAVVAKENNIPFYVAAPMATIDKNCSTGDEIPIEERNNLEVAGMFGIDINTGKETTIQIAPKKSPVKNPAFDVTPAKYISGIITEKGIFNPSDIRNLF